MSRSKAVATAGFVARLRKPVVSVVAVAAVFACPGATSLELQAQGGGSAGFALTIPNIMRGPEHFGREPANVRWSADGAFIYFQWNPPSTRWDEPLKPYRVRAAGGGAPEPVTLAHMDSMAPLLADGPTTRNGLTRAVAARGDLFLIDTKKASVRQVTATVATEFDPRFSADESQLLFQRDGNAFAFDMASGLVRQLTDIRSGTAPRDSARAGGQKGALERDQRDLFDVIRDRARADSLQRLDRQAVEALRLQPLYLGTERVISLSVSPTLRTALIVTSADAGGGRGNATGGAQGGAAGANRGTIVPAFVTSSGYTEDIPGRTKVGDANPRLRLGQVNLAAGTVRWLSSSGGDGERAMTSVQIMDWNSDGTSAAIATVTADFKSRYILSISGDSATPKTVDALRDSAWVNGPCFGCGGFLPDGRVWFVSEASGYAQLYAVNVDGSARVTLTEGKWEVERAEISADRKWFWLHTSEESPFTRQLWRMPVGGGARVQVTKEHGGHNAVVSPDGRRIADVFSQANVPPELFVADAMTGAARAQLTTSTSPEFRAGKWIKPEIVMVTASDGVMVPSRIYRPQEFGATPNGAAVIFVHGAGYLHNVHDFWSSYSREYMFNHLLASKGYVVLDMDYRGSAGYGRDWRTAIYRFMGGRDLQDEVDGSRYLQQQFRIDPERIGLYGGSYGGFMTLMALFTEPKQFGAGAALRSVTDWAHYNHGYTGRILNLPQDDTLAYRRSSPIFHADGLEDPLLMLHGMVDTNVNFQDIVRLTEKLIELGKTGWDLAVYPVEDHGFVRPTSWTDEYRRIFDLFERTIGPNGSKVKR